MSKIKLPLWQSLGVYTLSCLLVSFTNWTPPAQADCLIWFLCSGQGSGVTKGGATRGLCATPAGETPLIALVSEDKLESTTQAYPTFWFYLPAYLSTAKEARFMVLDAEKRPVLTEPIQVKLPGTSGIAEFTLPNTGKSLEVGKQYTWYFEVICDRTKPDRNPVVSGRIERVQPGSELGSQRPEKPYLVSANNQVVWYDTLTQLARNHTLYPEDWMALLKRSEIPESVAQQPIVELQPMNEAPGN